MKKRQKKLPSYIYILSGRKHTQIKIQEKSYKNKALQTKKKTDKQNIFKTSKLQISSNSYKKNNKHTTHTMMLTFIKDVKKVFMFLIETWAIQLTYLSGQI